MEKIISLAKQRGFIYQGSEIYGGLAGTFDYGPLGVTLKKNIENVWWKRFVTDREDMYGIDASILMNQEVWKASGHVGGFSDPLVECKKCKRRFRADHLEDKKKCPECGGELGEEKQFNMMFKTHVGAAQDDASVSYLRPETAQGMFVNFKNVIDSFHPKLPFGMAQIGKAFRNEIAPRDFIFRVRELEQMEIEYFVKPDAWEEVFKAFQKEQLDFLLELGLSKEKIHQVDIKPEDRAHYSKHSVDTEFDFPIGQKELLGLAYRTDFDLRNHSTASGADLSYFDEETKTRYIPHCIEPTFGLGRLILAVLCDAYTEDMLGGELRVFLKISPKIAPVKVAVFPLLKNKPVLVEKAREIYKGLRTKFPGIVFDDNGNIGKRYRRQDEIGTPYCVTVDFETVEKDQKVTVRDRDTGKQERVTIEELHALLEKNIR
ncbi:MAG: glycine--tRNA ligase [Candidatus Pacebacteria bacterium]|jgi:glycyl-tRNA synthetase|nr:glycine--tRNA ligase [Candidatus Paceibacterota bacterium]